MNAVMREPDEARVVANETIEVILDSLRKGLDDVKEDVRDLKADVGSLRDKVDRNYETLSQGQTALRDKLDSTRTELIDRIDQVRSDLGNEIKQVRTDLGNEIKEVRTEMGKEFKEVRKELAATNVVLAGVAAWQKILLWAIGGIAGAAALAEVVFRLGDRLHWFH
jgi:predicted  nucleic acid-binding Zn-ribbon protein